MRLTPDEAAGIRAAAEEVFGPEVVVRLFGSRVDDARRGGDIDLLVEVPPGRGTFRDERDLAMALEEKLGERKIDALLVEPNKPRRPIHEDALREGIVLTASENAKARPLRVGSLGWEGYVLSRPDMLPRSLDAVRRLSHGLRASVTEISDLIPLDASTIDALPRDREVQLQAFMKVFEQLQDMASRRLMRAILDAGGESTSRMSAIDAFNKLEALGAIDDARRFAEIAVVRNQLSHDYPADAQERAERLNDAFEKAPTLLAEVDRLVAYAARYTEGNAA